MTHQFNRTAIYIALGLSLVMVVAVIFGAKFVYENVAKAPVAMAPVQSDHADSPECAAAIEAAPKELMGQPRAEIAEPVPAGAAAWASNSEEKVTLRCGVDLPLQYTEYSQTEDVEGEAWLQVKDMTPGSDLTTWYSTERFPVLAVTTFDDSRPEGLGDVLAAVPAQHNTPAAAPLSELKAGPDSMCADLNAALPESIAEGYERRSDVPTKDASAKNVTVWSATGREDIVVRCGVAPPENYRAGVQLQQVNDVPWFEDTTLGEGTTSGRWFALGRANDLVLSAPQDAANSALVKLSDALVETTPEQ
ncbi:DUF3515 domain-containing protein [Corynebacterium sp.]|uniref:DUF3515 domain-containing protein n=1 Tax=Corynebacterium sp. TaxID=1720 RepID=UPI0026DD3D9B|nr:DUF3515 domain-containing protein [Corynebacterium sp.]MDO5031497.1 DUF3515 domain-containing protein [Corynebacterium sp.]